MRIERCRFLRLGLYAARIIELGFVVDEVSQPAVSDREREMRLGILRREHLGAPGIRERGLGKILRLGRSFRAGDEIAVLLRDAQENVDAQRIDFLGLGKRNQRCRRR